MRILSQRTTFAVDPARGAVRGSTETRLERAPSDSLLVLRAASLEIVSVTLAETRTPLQHTSSADTLSVSLPPLSEEQQGILTVRIVFFPCPAQLCWYRPVDSRDRHRELLALNAPEPAALFPFPDTPLFLELVFVVPNSEDVTVASPGRLRAVAEHGQHLIFSYTLVGHPRHVLFAVGTFSRTDLPDCSPSSSSTSPVAPSPSSPSPSAPSPSAAASAVLTTSHSNTCDQRSILLPANLRSLSSAPGSTYRWGATLDDILSDFQGTVSCADSFVRASDTLSPLTLVFSRNDSGVSVCPNLIIFPISSLYGPRDIEPAYNFKRALSAAVADVVFSFLDWDIHDSWIPAGLSGYLADSCIRELLGQNEFFSSYYADRQYVVSADVYQPPLFYSRRSAASYRSEFFRKKSKLVFHCLEAHLSAAFLHQIASEVVRLRAWRCEGQLECMKGSSSEKRVEGGDGKSSGNDEKRRDEDSSGENGKEHLKGTATPQHACTAAKATAKKDDRRNSEHDTIAGTSAHSSSLAASTHSESLGASGRPRPQTTSKLQHSSPFTPRFAALIKATTGRDLGGLLEFYVFFPGLVRVRLSLTIDRTRNSVSVRGAQFPTSRLPGSNTRLCHGLVLRSYETEGNFEHVASASGETTFFYHARAKKRRREDEDNSEGALSLMFVRADPRRESLCEIVIDQPDFMLIEALSEKNVLGQLEAIAALKDKPSSLSIEALEKVLESSHAFYKVRIAALEALARAFCTYCSDRATSPACAAPPPACRSDSSDHSRQRLIQLFVRMRCVPGSTVLKANDFGLQAYFVQKHLLRVIGTGCCHETMMTREREAVPVEGGGRRDAEYESYSSEEEQCSGQPRAGRDVLRGDRKGPGSGFSGVAERKKKGLRVSDSPLSAAKDAGTRPNVSGYDAGGGSSEHIYDGAGECHGSESGFDVISENFLENDHGSEHGTETINNTGDHGIALPRRMEMNTGTRMLHESGKAGSECQETLSRTQADSYYFCHTSLKSRETTHDRSRFAENREALGVIKTEIALLRHVLQFNDNSQSAFDDGGYVATALTSLSLRVLALREAASNSRSMAAEAEKHLRALVGEVERLRLLDMLFPSGNNIVTCACLSAITRLARAGCVRLDLGPLRAAARRPNLLAVRLVAIEALLVVSDVPGVLEALAEDTPGAIDAGLRLALKLLLEGEHAVLSAIRTAEQEERNERIRKSCTLQEVAEKGSALSRTGRSGDLAGPAPAEEEKEVVITATSGDTGNVACSANSKGAMTDPVSSGAQRQRETKDSTQDTQRLLILAPFAASAPETVRRIEDFVAGRAYEFSEYVRHCVQNFSLVGEEAVRGQLHRTVCAPRKLKVVGLDVLRATLLRSSGTIRLPRAGARSRRETDRSRACLVFRLRAVCAVRRVSSLCLRFPFSSKEAKCTSAHSAAVRLAARVRAVPGASSLIETLLRKAHGVEFFGWVPPTLASILRFAREFFRSGSRSGMIMGANTGSGNSSSIAVKVQGKVGAARNSQYVALKQRHTSTSAADSRTGMMHRTAHGDPKIAAGKIAVEGERSQEGLLSVVFPSCEQHPGPVASTYRLVERALVYVLSSTVAGGPAFSAARTAFDAAERTVFSSSAIPSVITILSSELRSICSSFLDHLCGNSGFESFVEPVDIQALVTYRDIVRIPVCLSEIRNEIDSLVSYEVFTARLERIVRNCLFFNRADSAIARAARDFQAELDVFRAEIGAPGGALGRCERRSGTEVVLEQLKVVVGPELFSQFQAQLEALTASSQSGSGRLTFGALVGIMERLEKREREEKKTGRRLAAAAADGSFAAKLLARLEMYFPIKGRRIICFSD